MPIKTKLLNVCSFKLNETYDTLYELQERLGIDEEYLLNTSRNLDDDKEHVAALNEFLDALKVTRDNLVTWYLKQTLKELNVTLSLLNAKIKLIEYKLGQCDGLDLHQACSLSLVDFCNILADLTVLNVDPAHRKTMHRVSREVDIPVWLSHYRNQICHIPSESPCISILVPLVMKSLGYMKDHFWSKLVKLDNFDARRCKRIVSMVASFTNLKSVDGHMALKFENSLSKTKLKRGRQDLVRGRKACAALRKLLVQNPEQTLDVVIDFMNHHSLKTSYQNCSLLFEQVVLAGRFERLVIKLLNLAIEQPASKKIVSWIRSSAYLIFFRRPEKLKRAFARMNLHPSTKMKTLTDLPDVKCCHIFLKMIRLDDPMIDKIVLQTRERLVRILGRKRTMLFVNLTRIAKRQTKSI